MPQITNKTIGKVYKGSEGTNEHGPWTLYNIYLEGGELKYTYFQSGSKPVPEPGMKIALMEYTSEQNGEFTKQPHNQ